MSTSPSVVSNVFGYSGSVIVGGVRYVSNYRNLFRTLSFPGYLHTLKLLFQLIDIVFVVQNSSRESIVGHFPGDIPIVRNVSDPEEGIRLGGVIRNLRKSVSNRGFESDESRCNSVDSFRLETTFRD